MKLPIYQIDAFARRSFEGNPAAVVPLERWLSDETMQSIATENNLSETAFFVPGGDVYAIRWFTPDGEVKLCGHATLASAWVLFEKLGHGADQIDFDSKSGPLSVARDGEMLTLNFPLQRPRECKASEILVAGLGKKPEVCLENEDYMAVYAHQDDVAALTPDSGLLQQIGLRGVIVTARAQDYDFVSRFFAPSFGIPEDPVTGSSFTQLAPYWAGRLGKSDLRARQISKRGGDVRCRIDGDCVLISGHAVSYMQGQISI